MIRFRCHKCTKKIAVSDGWAGKVIKCPKCEIANMIPNPYDPDSDYEVKSEAIRIEKLEKAEALARSGRMDAKELDAIKRKLTEMPLGMPVDEQTLQEMAEAAKKAAKRGKRVRTIILEDPEVLDPEDVEDDGLEAPIGVLASGDTAELNPVPDDDDEPASDSASEQTIDDEDGLEEVGGEDEPALDEDYDYDDEAADADADEAIELEDEDDVEPEPAADEQEPLYEEEYEDAYEDDEDEDAPAKDEPEESAEYDDDEYEDEYEYEDDEDEKPKKKK